MRNEEIQSAIKLRRYRNMRSFLSQLTNVKQFWVLDLSTYINIFKLELVVAYISGDVMKMDHDGGVVVLGYALEHSRRCASLSPLIRC